MHIESSPEQVQTAPGPFQPERAWQFILDYPRPPKGLSANDRTHWAAKAGASADVRLEVMAKTRALRLGALEKISVQVTWVVADHRKRDEDGPDPFCKAIYDGIGSSTGVSARLVEDDSPEYMLKPRLVIRYEKDARAHFEVTITDLGGDS
jgi:Endodeoxyribonuclease RusA.